MIGFLLPLFLLAGLAATIPLILHLMRRHDVRRVTFPAVRYLRRAERHARRLRLKHLLLLATRVALLLLLAIIAAGPVIGRGGPADHRPTALALIIDDSQSSLRLLDGHRLLDLFAERVQLTLASLGPDDRVALFSAAGQRPGLLAQGPESIRDYVREIDASPSTADLANAVRIAEAWARSAADGRAREIHILSDLQRNALPAEARSGEADSLAALVTSELVVFAPRLDPVANGATGEVIAEALPLIAGSATAVSVALDWFGPETPTDSINVRLVRDERVVAVSEGRFGAPALLRLPPQDSGLVQGYAEINASGLTADDRRYYSWLSRPAITVAVLGSPGDFLSHALAVLADAGRLRTAPPARAELVIADHASSLEAVLGTRRSAIVTPPDSVLHLPALNQRLAAARVPWRYERIDGGFGEARLVDAGLLPSLEGLSVRHWYQLVQVGLTTSDSTLVSLSTGEPWLVRGITSTGSSYILLASPLTSEASGVPASAAMIPLLDALIVRWSRPSSAPQLVGGEHVQLPSRARRLRLPDGTQTSIEGGGPYMAKRAGNYAALSEDGSPVLAFSVNAPIDEADLSAGDPAALQSAFSQARWTWVRDREGADWERAIFRARQGRMAWRALVAALALLAILEAGLAAAGRRERATAVGLVDQQLERHAAEAS